MKINHLDLECKEKIMDTNGFSYLNHNITKDNYIDDKFINEVFMYQNAKMHIHPKKW
jgi:hypothetical protein